MISSAHKRVSDITKTSAPCDTARPKSLVVNTRIRGLLVCDTVLTHESCLVPRDVL